MAEIYIGLMTGTSAASLDVAAVDFSNDQIKVVGQENFSIPHELKEEIKKNVTASILEKTSIGRLDTF